MIDPAPHIDTVEPRRLALVQRYAALDLVADDQFDTFIRLARTILDVPIAAISLVHRDHQQFMARIGLEVAETPRAQSFCAHALHGAEPLLVEDATRDGRFRDNPLVLGDPNIRFYVGVPLIAKQGLALGSICGIDTVPRQISGREMTALTDLATLTMQHMELRLQATLDGLTGAMRRVPFAALAQRDFDDCRRRNRPLACLLVDADHFKQINDTYGHAAGDEVLEAIVAVCDGCIAETDYIGRIGGEEFCIVLPDKTLEEACYVAETIRLGVEKIAVPTVNEPIKVTASIGVASMESRDTDFAALRERGDEAMYQAKRQGRNQVVHDTFNRPFRLAP
ncbi:sensor domain-containing diguanylate cyclase [Agrobacterium genomosp. 3]|uniref:GGDEF domain-containing protein n=1 Tax=Agrobacterium tomkonis TaxID=1183410 RepID=UPI001CD8A03C|nr:sensor domain-containing diguanylate cyclase [Agrobacterium tomkonis]MCA1878065.1 sensor domain-containing diguanylate cyclase [Agrobacterium tumefaciens]MCA1893290.1 sensor domain-containing diguanylate cyclase [Agrobacterium tomkonis]